MADDKVLWVRGGVVKIKHSRSEVKWFDRLGSYELFRRPFGFVQADEFVGGSEKSAVLCISRSRRLLDGMQTSVVWGGEGWPLAGEAEG